MALELTQNAIAALAQVAKEPNIVVKIEGVDRIFGAQIVNKYVRFGDGSEIGDPATDDDCFYIGGMNPVSDQDNIITLDGTSTSIRQSLDPSAGQGSSISNISIAFMDDGYATLLITPGEIIDDIMQRKVKVYYGFKGTAWPDDYIIAFRGVVTDVLGDAGKIVMQLNAPEEKKRTNIFKTVQTVLLNAIDADDTTICVESVADFIRPITGPFGTEDDSFKTYIRIDDEMIEFNSWAVALVASPITFTIGSATISGLGSLNLVVGQPVTLATTGALPTGFTAGTTYYVRSTTFLSFTLSATPGGTAITATVSQSGVHTLDAPATLKNVVRGQLATLPGSHDADAQVSTFHTLTGNAVDLALKLMLSGNVEANASVPFIQNIRVDAINLSPDGTRVNNGLFFYQVNVVEEYGLSIGDSMSVLDANFPNNGQTSKAIIDIVHTDQGDFVVLDDVTLQDMVYTDDDPITVSFISQYATLPDGCRMAPDEVDIAEHERLKHLFLSGTNYLFYIKEGIEDAREFLEKEIYMPMASYSLPRKARASMGYHIGPIPGVSLVTFDESNIRTASKMTVRRSTNKNFYNEVVYKYDESALEDKFNTGYIAISEDSKNRIKHSPNRTLTIEAKGMRSTLAGPTVASIGSTRKLKRYQYGAEVFNFEVLLEAGFGVEIGDIIILDATNLKLPDIKTGQKGMRPRLLEIQNKDFQLKTGLVRIEAVDTSFDGAARYGLVSPSSRIKSGISSTEFMIEPSFKSRFGQSEYRKWSRFKRPSVRVRNADFSVNVDTVIVSAESNRIVVEDMGLTPVGGMYLELTAYTDPDVTDQVKLIYAHMRDSAFPDGKPQYQML